MKSLYYMGIDSHKETLQIDILKDNDRNVEFERQNKNEPARIIKLNSKIRREYILQNNIGLISFKGKVI